MKYLDPVEVIVEKEQYAKHGVHKGMQGTIFDERKIDGLWLVYFTTSDPNVDIGDIPILEEDLKLLTNGFNSIPNEYIKEQFERSQI